MLSSTEDRARAYATRVEAHISDKEWELIRRATKQGRVVGSESFQEEIGSKVGRRLIGETRGCPRQANWPAEIALWPLVVC